MTMTEQNLHKGDKVRVNGNCKTFEGRIGVVAQVGSTNKALPIAVVLGDEKHETDFKPEELDVFQESECDHKENGEIQTHLEVIEGTDGEYIRKQHYPVWVCDLCDQIVAEASESDIPEDESSVPVRMEDNDDFSQDYPIDIQEESH